MSLAPTSSRVTTAIRCGAAALAATGALLAAGCGSTGTPARHSHQATGRQVTARQASATTFTRLYSTQQVMQHFAAVTGEKLTDNPDAQSWDSLSMADTGMAAYNRYGIFTINVLHTPSDLSVFTEQNGQSLVPDGNGVYWPRTADAQGYYNPSKIYGNVVLTWTTQTRSDNAQFHLLDAILSTVGKSVSAATAKMPASELSCAGRGITAASAVEGTCTQNNQTVTVVNGNHTLQAKDLDVSIAKTVVGGYINAAYNFGTPLYAQGAFVGIALKMSNPGTQPLEDLFSTELEVNGRFYSQDENATMDLEPPSDFPVQPGESSNTVLVFDIPRSVAAQSLKSGELVFPEDDPELDISDCSHIGAIRLAGSNGAADSPVTVSPA